MATPLSVRLDEAAVAVRHVTVPRLGLSLFGTLMAAMILAPVQALAWLGVSLSLEAWLWIASRGQIAGGPVRHRARANFLVSFTAISLWWLVLGMMFWNADTLAGRTCAAILAITVEGVHTYLSPAVECVLGYRSDELIGVTRIGLVHPDDHPSALAAVGRMLEDPSRREVITTRVRHKDGHWVWLQTHAKVVCEFGVPVGVIDVSRDITEQVAKDAALR